MSDLTPREIVSELDRFIIGQNDAKRAVSVALRSRWRRKQLPADLQDEVYPKNILMIGPTGVGKTEISRRLAKLSNAPFVKVEATKFTEVGYVGRDVEQIIRDLVDAAINSTRIQMREDVKANALKQAQDRVIDAIAGPDARDATREMFRRKLLDGELDSQEIEIEVSETTNPMPMFDIPGQPGSQMGMMNIGDIFGKAFGGRTVKRKVQENGIVFLDEIDKVCARADARGADVSREGVQRDLLPLIEGTTVSTKYGPIKTDHILFIASGAFHVAKPSDLLPELQGRLPIRVELPEGVTIEFEDSGIREIAKIAASVNQSVENIGARRLYTVMERIFEELSFSAPDKSGEAFTVDAAFVQQNIGELSGDADLSRFVL